MNNAAVLGVMLARRSRAVTRYLAAIVGLVTAVAICGLFGLITFLDAAGQRGTDRAIGHSRSEGGCIQAEYRYTYFRLGQYERLLVASTCDNPAIPLGLDSFPKPGDVYVSPALNALRSTDSSIATQFPSVTGIIAPEGLVHRNELRVVAGFVADRDPAALGFDQFGSEGDYLATALRLSRGTLYGIGGFMIVLPAAYLVSVATRVNARMRERQLGLLGVLGFDASTARRTLTWEAGITVGCGAAIGSIVALPLLARATPTFVGWTAFPGDMFPAWYAPVVAFAATTMIALAAAWVAGKRVVRGRRMESRRRNAGIVTSVGIFSAGIIAGAASGWWSSDAAWPVVLGGRIATFVGIILVIAVVLSALGRHLASDDDGLTALVGQRLRTPSGALTRSLAALSSGLFLLSAGLVSVSSLDKDPAAMHANIKADGNSVLVVQHPNPDMLALVAEYPDRLIGPTESALVDSATNELLATGSVVGTCDSVQTILAIQIDCNDSPFYVRFNPEAPVPPGIGVTPIDSQSGQVNLLLSGVIINTTNETPSAGPDDRIVVSVPDDSTTHLYDQLLATSPEASVHLAGAAMVGGASELDDILDVFRWGAYIAVTASFLGALFSLVSLLHDRQAANNYLQILGVSPRQAAGVGLIEVVVAAGSAIAVSLFASWVWALSYSINSNNPFIGIIGLLTPFIGGLIAIGGASGLIIWMTLRNSGVSVVPDRDGLAAPHDVYNAS